MSRAAKPGQSNERRYQQTGASPSVAGGIGWGLLAYVFTWLGLIGVNAYGFSRNAEARGEASQQLKNQYGDVIDAINGPQTPGEPVVEVVLWAFYGGHGVPIEVTFGSGSQTLSMLEAQSAMAGLSTTAYLLVPACSLALCGYALASRSGATEPVGGAICGAFVGLGYGGLFLLGVPLASIEATDGSFRFSPSTADAVVRGIGYPLVAGGLGGVLAGIRG